MKIKETPESTSRNYSLWWDNSAAFLPTADPVLPVTVVFCVKQSLLAC